MDNARDNKAGNDDIHCKAVLLDIEGTTTSISFVKDTLFPYVTDNIEQYLVDHWSQEECIKDVSGLSNQAVIDVENCVGGVSVIPNGGSDEQERQSIVKYVKLLVSEDRKVTALKDLQGHMWRHAYETGKIKGHVYPDVPLAMSVWFKKRIKMYIYSSGSVEAQKLLFGNSEAGDLLKYISGHFDTKTGNKCETSSYTKIANEIGLLPSQVLFLTDIVQEAEAAEKSGMQSAILRRPGNADVGDKGRRRFRTLASLTDLNLFTVEESDRREADFQNDILPDPCPCPPSSKKCCNDTISDT